MTVYPAISHLSLRVSQLSWEECGLNIVSSMSQMRKLKFRVVRCLVQDDTTCEGIKLGPGLMAPKPSLTQDSHAGREVSAEKAHQESDLGSNPGSATSSLFDFA